MKVQLIYAPSEKKIILSDLAANINPPLGILYLAGYLRKHLPDIELKATDGLLLGWDRTLSEIETFGPDVIFLSYLTPCAIGAYELARHVKELYPHVITVFGGPHATALPFEAFERSCADFVAVGEGEETALELLRAILKKERDLRHIDGLYWNDGGKIIGNRPRQFISNLDDIPFPARDLIDLGAYKGWVVCRQTPETNILFSRGCPFDCTFCTNAVWKSSKPWLRLRSPKNIADEMEALRDLGIKEVFDVSDEFNHDIAHAMAVCEEFKRRKLTMPWKAQLRVNPLPEELVRAMAEAGCWYVHVGIESGNERALKGIKKGINLEQVVRACRLIKKYDIKIFGLFMLFNVWEEDGALAFEGVKETAKTLDFAGRMINDKLLDYMSCTVTTPYPGSELFDIATKFSLIKDELLRNWSLWLSDEFFIMDLPGVTESEMSRLYLRGSFLRGYCYLKSGNWSLKDVPLFLGKFSRAMMIGLNSLFNKRA